MMMDDSTSCDEKETPFDEHSIGPNHSKSSMTENKNSFDISEVDVLEVTAHRRNGEAVKRAMLVSSHSRDLSCEFRRDRFETAPSATLIRKLRINRNSMNVNENFERDAVHEENSFDRKLPKKYHHCQLERQERLRQSHRRAVEQKSIEKRLEARSQKTNFQWQRDAIANTTTPNFTRPNDRGFNINVQWDHYDRQGKKLSKRKTVDVKNYDIDALPSDEEKSIVSSVIDSLPSDEEKSLISGISTPEETMDKTRCSVVSAEKYGLLKNGDRKTRGPLESRSLEIALEMSRDRYNRLKKMGKQKAMQQHTDKLRDKLDNVFEIGPSQLPEKAGKLGGSETEDSNATSETRKNENLPQRTDSLQEETRPMKNPGSKVDVDTGTMSLTVCSHHSVIEGEGRKTRCRGQVSFEHSINPAGCSNTSNEVKTTSGIGPSLSLADSVPIQEKQKTELSSFSLGKGSESIKDYLEKDRETNKSISSSGSDEPEASGIPPPPELTDREPETSQQQKSDLEKKKSMKNISKFNYSPLEQLKQNSASNSTPVTLLTENVSLREDLPAVPVKASKVSLANKSSNNGDESTQPCSPAGCNKNERDRDENAPPEPSTATINSDCALVMQGPSDKMQGIFDVHRECGAIVSTTDGGTNDDTSLSPTNSSDGPDMNVAADFFRNLMPFANPAVATPNPAEATNFFKGIVKEFSAFGLQTDFSEQEMGTFKLNESLYSSKFKQEQNQIAVATTNMEQEDINSCCSSLSSDSQKVNDSSGWVLKGSVPEVSGTYIPNSVLLKTNKSAVGSAESLNELHNEATFEETQVPTAEDLAEVFETNEIENRVQTPPSLDTADSDFTFSHLMTKSDKSYRSHSQSDFSANLGIFQKSARINYFEHLQNSSESGRSKSEPDGDKEDTISLIPDDPYTEADIGSEGSISSACSSKDPKTDEENYGTVPDYAIADVIQLIDKFQSEHERNKGICSASEIPQDGLSARVGLLRMPGSPRNEIAVENPTNSENKHSFHKTDSRSSLDEDSFSNRNSVLLQEDSMDGHSYADKLGKYSASFEEPELDRYSSTYEELDITSKVQKIAARGRNLRRNSASSRALLGDNSTANQQSWDGSYLVHLQNGKSSLWSPTEESPTASLRSEDFVSNSTHATGSVSEDFTASDISTSSSEQSLDGSSSSTVSKFTEISSSSGSNSMVPNLLESTTSISALMNQDSCLSERRAHEIRRDKEFTYSNALVVSKHQWSERGIVGANRISPVDVACALLCKCSALPDPDEVL